MRLTLRQTLVSALLDLQLRCRDAFLFGRGSNLEAALREGVVEPSLQIEIYENNVRENFRKALEATYAVVAALVGADCFAALARQYQRMHPSKSGDLGQFGDDFPGFLDGIYGHGEYAYLGDVARLEHAIEAARFAADVGPADLTQLADLNETALEALLLLLHPSVAVLRSSHPLYSIWFTHQDQNVRVDLERGAEQVLIFRAANSVRVERIDRARCEFIQALLQLQPIAVALQRALTCSRSFDVAAALHALAIDGLIVDIVR